jgi:hypothetical protein
VYARAIHERKEIFDKYINEKYSFNFFENGDAIQNFHRRIYRSLLMKGESRFENPFLVNSNSLHQVFKNKGMIKISDVNLDKVTKENLHGVEKKLIVFNRATRLLYKLIGFEKYMLFIKLLRSFGRYESQIHIINNQYDKNNIKFNN